MWQCFHCRDARDPFQWFAHYYTMNTAVNRQVHAGLISCLKVSHSNNGTLGDFSPFFIEQYCHWNIQWNNTEQQAQHRPHMIHILQVTPLFSHQTSWPTDTLQKPVKWLVLKTVGSNYEWLEVYADKHTCKNFPSGACPRPPSPSLLGVFCGGTHIWGFKLWGLWHNAWQWRNPWGRKMAYSLKWDVTKLSFVESPQWSSATFSKSRKTMASRQMPFV